MKQKSVKEYFTYLELFQTLVHDPLKSTRQEIVDAISCVKQERNWGDQTTWRFSALIKRFYDFCTLYEIIPIHPYNFNAFRKPRLHVPKFLTESEFRQVIDFDLHLTHQDKLCLWILWDTALRREELRLLDQTDFDLKEKIIFLPAEKSKGEYGQRYVGMSDRTMELLEYQLEILGQKNIGPHLLCGENWDRINADELTNRIIRAGKVCSTNGYIKINPRMLRHSLAVRLKMRGASDLEIMMILGHASLEMTRRYSHVSKSFAKSLQDKYLRTA